MRLESQTIQDDPVDPCSIDPCPCAQFFDPKDRPSVLDDITVYTHEPRLLIICTSKTLEETQAMIDRRWAFAQKEPCKNGCLMIKERCYHYHFRCKAAARFTIRMDKP